VTVFFGDVLGKIFQGARRAGGMTWCDSEVMFKRVGFFHFVQNQRDPLGSLDKALKDRSADYMSGDISGSLIVLPEAFNLGKSYYHLHHPKTTWTQGGAMFPLWATLEWLRNSAAARGVVFVAGLVGDQFSSAYWVDYNGPPHLMCHKLGEDHSGNYWPWVPGDGNGDNPIERYGACVGSLICLDALEAGKTAIRQRRENLISDIKSRDRLHGVLCVPMRKRSQWDPESPRIDGLYCIVADSGGAHPSFVAKGSKTVASPMNPQQDEICFATFASF